MNHAFASRVNIGGTFGCRTVGNQVLVLHRITPAVLSSPGFFLPMIEMLRAAVQNSILIALIILILSFLIRNAKMERFPKEAPLAVPHLRDTLPGSDEHQASQPATEPDIELFQWAGIQPPVPYVSNQPPKDCDAHLDIDAYMKSKTEQGVAPKKQTRNTLTLSEYPNESIMNGGNIFTGITGFDSAENLFSEL